MNHTFQTGIDETKMLGGIAVICYASLLSALCLLIYSLIKMSPQALFEFQNIVMS